jgi:copper(I)-binding protein
LKKSLAPGDTVTVVFTFDDGSSATLTLPVGPATAAVPRNPSVVTASPGE